MNCFYKCIAIAAMVLVGILPASGGTQGAHPSFSGSKKMAIIMVSWSDKACPATRQDVVDRMWNDPKSARNYYLDLSRGALDFALPGDTVNGVVPSTTASVYGPYEFSIAAGFDKDVTVDNSSDLYGYRAQGAERPARILAADDGYNADDYDYIMYVTPKTSDTGGLRGYAYFNYNSSHIFRVSNTVINHELGHNLGMHHSNMGFGDGYGSYDCVMANSGVPHLDGPHTYQMGWYPHDFWSMKTYGQYDIENLAQPDTDNLKLLRFDRSAHGATNNSDQNFWVEYRKRGVGLDSDLNNRWDRSVTVHQSTPSSRRPGDVFGYPLTNQVANFQVEGSHTGTDNTCQIRFVRENESNASATVQLIDPDGNQPPTVIPNQHFYVGTVSNTLTVIADDPENDSLSYTLVSMPSHGTLTNSGSSFTYTASIPGDYSFTVRVNDSQYDSFDEVVRLTVQPASTPTLYYATTIFPEYFTRDGIIPDMVNIDLILDTFSGLDGRDLVADGDITVTNLPPGLTALVIKVSDVKVGIVLSGKALNHGNTDDVTNLTFAFADTAFTSGSASGVASSSRNDLFINFSDSTGWTNPFYEGFESPVVSGFEKESLPNNGNWVGSKKGSDSRGIVNEDSGDFTNLDTTNNQAFALRHTKSVITTAEGVIGALQANAAYQVSFKVAIDGGLNGGTPYTCQLIAFDTDAIRSKTREIPDGSTLLDSVTGYAKIDGSFTTIDFPLFSVDPINQDAEIGKDLGLRFIGGTNSAIIDDVIVLAQIATGSLTVTYDGNNSDGGEVPVDSTSYTTGDSVTVLSNIGSLVKSGYIFNGWNTVSDGSGTSYAAGATFSISQNAILYSNWMISYSNWISSYNLGGLSRLNDDADNDGVPNGLENFFGTSPTQASRGVEASGINANTFTFTHPESAAPAADLVSAYRWSKGLSQFNLGGVTDGDGTQVDFTVQRNTPSAGITTVTATLTGAPAGRLFFDIMVTQP